MRKSSTNQLTVLNASKFLMQECAGKNQGLQGKILLLEHSKHVSISRPVLLAFVFSIVMLCPQISTWCTSEFLHVFTQMSSLWESFIFYRFNLSIFLPWESGSSTLHAARKLKHCHLVSCSNILWCLHWPRCCPLVTLGKIVVKPSHNTGCHRWTSE